jgi:hypothetical protein
MIETTSELPNKGKTASFDKISFNRNSRIGLYVFVTHVGLLLILLRLSFIAKYGTDIPYWDQWEAQGKLLFGTISRSGVGAVDWFAPHNEHRIVTARLWTTMIWIANSIWSPRLEMALNAVLAVASLGAIVAFCAKQATSNWRFSLPLMIVLLFSFAPTGWDNTIGAFQSPFYILMICVVWMAFAISAPALAVRHYVGLIAASVFALFTLATGLLVPLIAAIVLAIRILLHGNVSRRPAALTLCSLVLLFGVGLMLTTHVAGHDPLRAPNFLKGLESFTGASVWPLPSFLFPVIWLPICVLAIKNSKRIASGSDHELYILLVLALFALASAAGIAYARGGFEGPEYSSRYCDTLWLGIFVNVAAACVLSSHGSKAMSSYWLWFAIAATFAVFISGVSGGLKAFQDMQIRGEAFAVQSRNVAQYVATNDAANILGRPFFTIPYPSDTALKAMLDDPAIRSILPSQTSPGLLFRVTSGVDGWRKNGAYPVTPSAPKAWIGSYTEQGNPSTGVFQTDYVHLSSGKYFLYMAGYPNEANMSLLLENKNGSVTTLVVDKNPKESWSKVSVSLESGEYRYVSSDKNPEFWFAFSDLSREGRFDNALKYVLDNSLFYFFALLLTLVGFLIATIANLTFRATRPENT